MAIRSRRRASSPRTPPPRALRPVVNDKTLAILEKVFSDSFKREFDQEENVWRTLPPFATSIGLLAGVGTLLHSSLPPVGTGPFAFLSWSFVALLTLSIGALFWFLREATREGDVGIPAPGSAFLEFAQELRLFYSLVPGSTPSEVDEAVAADLREQMVRQLAESAESSREKNFVRITARSRAFNSLGLALIFAFCLIGTILIPDAFKEPPSHDLRKPCGATP